MEATKNDLSLGGCINEAKKAPRYLAELSIEEIEKKKAKGYELYKTGMKAADVARALEVSRSTFHNWLSKAEKPPCSLASLSKEEIAEKKGEVSSFMKLG